MNKTVRKAVVVAAVVLLAAAVAYGAPGAKVTLKVWDWQVMGNYMTAYQKIFDLYMHAHPNVEIQRTTVASGEFEKQFKAALAGDEAPDMFQVQLGIQVSAYYEAGILDNFMPDFLADSEWQKYVNYREGQFGGYFVGDKLVALPAVDQWIHAIYYYKDKLSRFGLNAPRTISDFISMSAKLNANKVIPMSIAFGPNSIVWIPNSAAHELIMQYYGSDALSRLENGKLSWQDPKVKACFQALKDLQNNKVFPKDVNSAEYFPDVLTRFQNKEAWSFFPAGDWTIGSMNKDDVNNDNLAVMPWPVVTKDAKPGYGASAAIAYGVKPGNPNRSAIIDLVKFMLSEEPTKVLIEQGIHPISRTALKLPVSNKLMKAVLQESSKSGYWYSPFMINSNPELGRREIDDLGKLFANMMTVDQMTQDLDTYTQEVLAK
jgi:ABC-type glycerol-3-phosphate transport system substrate-binding protein